MPRIVRLPLPEGDRDAIEVDFEIPHEDWNEYRLKDGGKVRVRTSVQKIYWLVSPKGEKLFGPDGDPQMVIRHNTEVIASA